MADSILRLKVDSQEYDQKIKRAAEGIQQYAQKCREAGGTLQYLDDGVLEFVQALGKMDTVATGTKQQLREMSNALTTLTQTYRGLTDEEKASPFGQELAKGIQQLTERAGQAQDAMADVQASIRNAASDTRLFDQMAQGMSVATASIQGLTGAAKLFGIESKDNLEVIAKLQAAMAVTNSLTTIQKALQKESALMQGVLAIQAKAAAAAIELEGSATKGATVAQAAFNAVAKANPYVLLASAVAAVGVALVGFTKNTKEAESATKEETEAMKQAARMADIWKNTMGSTYSSLMTKYDELKRQWHSLASEHSKTEWIKKNQTALQNLGGAVNDVKSAEDFFNNNTDAVVQSFVRRAEAAARVAQLTELYRQQIELLDKKEQASTAIRNDAARSGRSAQAGDEIKDQTYRNSRYGSVNQRTGKWEFSEAGAKLYSGTDTSTADAVVKIDVELQANESKINKVKSQITDAFKDITITPGSGSGTGNGETNVEKELTIQQQIAELEKEALNASKERRVRIAEIIQDLDRQLQKQKELVASLHQVPIDPKSIKAGDPSKMGITLPVTIKEETLQQQVQKIADAARAAMANTDLADPMLAKFQEVFVDSNALGNLMKTAIENGLDTSDIDFTGLKEQLAKGLDIDDSALQELVDKINEKLKSIGKDPIKLDFDKGSVTSVTGNLTKDAKQNQQAWSAAASAVSSLSSALQSLEDPSAKIAGIVGQAVANIALGFAQATASPATGAAGVFGWIAAATAGLATMLTTITSIKSVTKGGFAEGGIVPGNSYSGDRLNTAMYGINSGELILSRSQQNNIAAQLEGGSFSNFQLTSRVSGRDLVLTINNQQTVNNKPKLNFK